jgi:hypothetical protein
LQHPSMDDVLLSEPRRALQRPPRDVTGENCTRLVFGLKKGRDGPMWRQVDGGEDGGAVVRQGQVSSRKTEKEKRRTQKDD